MSEDLDEHAEKSPSGAHRWMECAASVVLEADEPDSESAYAAEGTLAHALAYHCFRNKLAAKKVLLLKHKGKDEIISSEMADFVQEYIDQVLEDAKGGNLLIEQKMDLEPLTGEKGAKCTADVVIITGDLLQITDFKYGAGKFVNAQGNPQTRMYGLAALDQFEVMGDFKHVRLGIHQPRMENIDEETLTVAELHAFADEVRTAVRRVEQAKKSNSLDGFYSPSKKTCQWCKAKAKCPALATVVVEATAADFDDVSQVQLIDPVNLSKAMSKIGMIEEWCSGVRGKVESELLAGRPVAGFKLVEGKLSNRAWLDETIVVKKALALGASEEDVQITEARSPAQMEKKLKKQPKIWTAMQKLLATRKPGPPSVAPVNDPRTEYKPNGAADFEDVSGDDLEIPASLKRKKV